MKLIKNTINNIKRIIPDKLYLKLQYRYHLKKNLNLKDPTTFSEKIQWLKLYDRKPEYITFVDKYRVREYIEKKIGEEYLIPLIAVYESVDEINWEELPKKFILKCTHGSQCNILCADKSKLNIEESIIKLKKWMSNNWYWYGREWPYKDVKPRIICEEFLEEIEGKSLTDYKIYCFNGKPLYCQMIRNRGYNETIDFYDDKWNQMPFTGLRNLPMSKVIYEKPKNYEKMFELSKVLSDGIPFIRVDFYSVSDKLYFGELTLYPTSGYGKFTPEEWNLKMGEWLVL